MLFQIFTTNPDRNGNPRKLLLVYDMEGNVISAYKYSYSSPNQIVGGIEYTQLPSFNLTVKDYRESCNEFNAVELS